jgi:hypothetical protein
MSSTARLVERIRQEYAAMPGLKLTREQACKLWGVGHDTCAEALDVLLAEGFLQRTGTGKYVALPRAPRAPLGVSAERLPSSMTLRCPECGKRNVVELTQTLIGHDLASTIRCEACHRILNFVQRSA